MVSATLMLLQALLVQNCFLRNVERNGNTSPDNGCSVNASGAGRSMYTCAPSPAPLGRSPTCKVNRYPLTIASYSRTSEGTYHHNYATPIKRGQKRGRVVESLKENSDGGSRKAVIKFSNELKRWIRMGKVETAEEELLHRLRQYDLNASKLMPDRVHFGIVVNGWAKSRSIERAEVLVEKMEQLSIEEGKYWLNPNVVVYNTLISSYAREGNVKKALSILAKMEHLYFNENNVSAKPDLLTCNFVMDAVVKSYRRGSNKGPMAVQQAEALIERMERCYGVTPDVITYNLAINAWVKSNEPDAARHAERLLKTMIDRAEHGGIDSKPDLFTYNSILNAWARSKEVGSARRAHELLDAMEGVYKYAEADGGIKPNFQSYSTVINAYAKSSDPNSGEKASELLGRMTGMYNAGQKDLKPDLITYTGVMQAIIKDTNDFSHLDAAHKATKMLNYIESVFDQTGDEQFRPDRSVYNLVLGAWSKSSAKNAAAMKRSIRERMIQRNIRTYRNPLRRSVRVLKQRRRTR